MINTDIQKLQHTLWECKYHIVFIPKYSVSNVIGYIKGKSTIYIAKYYKGKKEILPEKDSGLEVILFPQ